MSGRDAGLKAKRTRRGSAYFCVTCQRGWMSRGPMIQHLRGGAHGLPYRQASGATVFADMMLDARTQANPTD